MLIYCYKCNHFHEADIMTVCPHCGAVGDDLVECEYDDSLEEEEEEERDLEQDAYDDWVDSQVNAMLEARYGL